MEILLTYFDTCDHMACDSATCILLVWACVPATLLVNNVESGNWCRTPSAIFILFPEGQGHDVTYTANLVGCLNLFIALHQYETVSLL